MGILNPGNDIANVTIEAFDASNDSLGIVHSQTILPGVTYVINTTNLDTIEGDAIPSNTAILKVTSTQPVIGYEVIGILDGNGLAAVMGIPEEDHTSVGFELIGSMDGGVLNTYSMMRMGDGSVESSAISLENGEWSKDVLLETLLEQKIPKIETNATSSKKKVYLVPSIEDKRTKKGCKNSTWKRVCHGEQEGYYQNIIAQEIKDILSSQYDVKIFDGTPNEYDCSSCGYNNCMYQSDIGKRQMNGEPMY